MMLPVTRLKVCIRTPGGFFVCVCVCVFYSVVQMPLLPCCDRFCALCPAPYLLSRVASGI